MERTDANTPLEKTGPKGSWLVVVGPAGRYIGLTESTRDEVGRIHDSGNTIKFTDAFEFTSQLQVNQVPDPSNPRQAAIQIGKMNLAYRIDAAMFPVPVTLSLRGTMIYWLDDLKEPDAAIYKDLIQGAVRMADGWHRERVKSTTGVEVATSIPRGVPMPGMPHGFGG